MKVNFKMVASVLGAGMIIFNSCSKDNESGTIDKGDGTDTGKSKFVFVTFSDGSAGEAARYIISADDIKSGEVSIKNNGVETNAYSFLAQNNTLFGITYAAQGPTQPFRLDENGVLRKYGNTVNTEFTGAYTPIGTDAYIGVSVARSLESPIATLYKFDAKNLMLAGRNTINLAKLTGNGEMANYNGIMEVNDKLYMPVNCTPGVTGQVTKYVDSTWIAVFKQSDMSFQKVIRDGRMGPIGNWFGMQGVQQIENGDVYAWSTSAGVTGKPSTKPSAIIKINATTDAVDPNYFFDVQGKTGKKIARGTHIKNGKFLMTLYQTEVTGGVSGGIVNLAIVDVINKTVTDVTGVPNHNQMPYDNKTLIDDEGNTAYYIMKDDSGNFYSYTIDTNTAKATRGIRFVGIQDVTAIAKLKY